MIQPYTTHWFYHLDAKDAVHDCHSDAYDFLRLSKCGTDLFSTNDSLMAILWILKPFYLFLQRLQSCCKYSQCVDNYVDN